ncbi:MAG: hypothetical protein ACJZ17_04335 [Acidimicrobiales bacterium]
MSSSEITWRDGAEDRMKSIFLSSDDRSSASDFLASHITDWPTRYHLDQATHKHLDAQSISIQIL